VLQQIYTITFKQIVNEKPFLTLILTGFMVSPIPYYNNRQLKTVIIVRRLIIQPEFLILRIYFNEEQTHLAAYTGFNNVNDY